MNNKIELFKDLIRINKDYTEIDDKISAIKEYRNLLYYFRILKNIFFLLIPIILLMVFNVFFSVFLFKLVFIITLACFIFFVIFASSFISNIKRLARLEIKRENIEKYNDKLTEKSDRLKREYQEKKYIISNPNILKYLTDNEDKLTNEEKRFLLFYKQTFFMNYSSNPDKLISDLAKECKTSERKINIL